MNKKKQIIIIILCMIIIAGGTVALTNPDLFIRYETDTSFLYENGDDGIVLTRYTGTRENVIVPNELEGKRVVGLKGAFCQNKTVVHVKISSGIETVDYMSFYECKKLVKVILPDTVKTVGHAAFARCTLLETVIIKNGLKEIMPYAFEGCTFLKNITLPDGLEFIGENAFLSCLSLRKAVIPASVRIIGGITEKAGEATNQIGSIKRTSFDKCDNLKIVIDSENPYYAVDDSGRIIKK